MSLDPIKNFGLCTIDGLYDLSATEITLKTGEGAKLPNPSVDGEFDLVWYNWTDYKDPSDDSNKEIVRCTTRSGDVLTVTRAQESTSASNKNTATKSYRMVLSLTKKMIDDMISEFVPYTGATKEIVLGQNLTFGDDQYLYFDTAKTNGVYYNSTWADPVWTTAYPLATEGEMYISANVGADGAGDAMPYIHFDSNGLITVFNDRVGDAGNRIFLIDTTDGLGIQTGGADWYALVRADNIATSSKTFQFPNIAGTIVTTNGALADVTLSSNLTLGDDKYLYFDTAENIGIRYSTDHSTPLLIGTGSNGSLSTDSRMTLYANTSLDASGNWEPYFDMNTGGQVKLVNTSQGTAGNKYFLIDMTDGIRLDTGGNRAIVLADNVATSDKTFQFPNITGTLVTTNGALANIDIGAYSLTAGTFTDGTLSITGGDLTTSGKILTTGGGATGTFLTGLQEYTVLAYTGNGFDIRAGDGNTASQNVLRVDNS